MPGLQAVHCNHTMEATTMSPATTTAEKTAADTQAITQLLQAYLHAAMQGASDAFKPLFSADATIHGYVGPDLFAGPIADFYGWHENNGPAKDVSMQIIAIDVEGTIATARIELTNWTGHRFTDMFTLLKTAGTWQIVSKVFELHG